MSSAVYYDLAASVVPISITFTATNGAAVDPSTVQLITTDPQGTQVTYTYAAGSGVNVITKVSTGNYLFKLQASVLYSPSPVPCGLWTAMWIGVGNTGGPGGTTVQAESFRILPYSSAPGTSQIEWYCGLDELKSRLSITDTASDYEMTTAIQAATNWINEYCQTPDTPVLNANLEWIPLGTLQVGDEIVGVDEYPTGGKYPKRKYRRATVEAVPRRVAECVKLTLADGREVTGSKDHKWLVKAGATYAWKKNRDIVPGDEICSPLRPWQTETSYEAGWAAGLYDGEGWIHHSGTRTHGVGVAQNAGPVLDGITQFLDKRGLPYWTQEAASDKCTRVMLSQRWAYMELVGSLRPKRLIARNEELWEDQPIIKRGANSVAVVRSENVGTQEVVSMKTSTGTYLANGLVSHNCGQHFYQVTESRTFTPTDIWLLDIDPIVSVSAFLLDYDGDGVFETSWTQNVNYQLRRGFELYNSNYLGVPRPYRQAQVLIGSQGAPAGGQFFPFVWPFTHLDRVKVTGVWGWPVIPPAVSQACLMLAAEYFKLKDSTFGVVGIPDLGVVKAGSNSWIVELLRPYIRGSRKVGM